MLTSKLSRTYCKPAKESTCHSYLNQLGDRTGIICTDNTTLQQHIHRASDAHSSSKSACLPAKQGQRQHVVTRFKKQTSVQNYKLTLQIRTVNIILKPTIHTRKSHTRTTLISTPRNIVWHILRRETKRQTQTPNTNMQRQNIDD